VAKRLKACAFYCIISAPFAVTAAPLWSALPTDLATSSLHAPPKDVWDKLYSISGIAVAIIGFYATYVYNRRQRASEENRKDQELLLAQIQTVEKFIPHFSSKDEQIKSAALVAIAALGNQELAVKLARAFAGPGATHALTKIASTAGPAGIAGVEGALLDAFSDLTPRIVSLYQRNHRRAHGLVFSRKGLLVTTASAIGDIPDSELSVAFPGNRRVAGRKMTIDRSRDLAMIAAVGEEVLMPLDVSPSPHRIGDTVIAFLLSPDGSLILRIGHFIALDIQQQLDIVVGPGLPHDASGRIAVRLEVKDGEIGAPVFDRDGRFLGLVAARNRGDTTILVPAAEVLKFTHEAEPAK